MINNVLKNLFDIKPVDSTGKVDLEKVTKVMPVVNLVSLKPVKKEDEKFFFGVWDDTGVKDLGVVDYEVVREKVKPKPKVVSTLAKVSPREELEALLSRSFNIKKEIKSIGGTTIVKNKIGKPRLRPILSVRKNTSDSYQTTLSQINQKFWPETEELFVGEPEKIDPISLGIVSEARPVVVSPEIESWVRYARDEGPAMVNGGQIMRDWLQIDRYQARAANFLSQAVNSLSIITGYWPQITKRLFKRNNFLAVGVVVFFALIFSSFGHYGSNIKSEVVKESSSGVANLEQANENLKVFNFGEASNNFTRAYEEFSKAGDNLNFMGASITSLFAELPGAGKLKSAKNLVEAGKLLAEAGKSMSEAVSSLSETGAIFDVTDHSNSSDIGDTIEDLKKSLVFSEKKLSKVNALLAEVDTNILPEEKRESFADFRSKLPELEKIVSDGVGYTDFLESFIGSDGVKKYLILFQNNSELRPTGGFPGTYAVVTFKDGRLSDFLVDDIYNLDGQLKESIIPPAQLQHITPTWGMRDANWFIDFSASAQKVMEFFNKEAGYEVDGVITMSPRMISDILKVVGPIEMSEYGFSLNDENFLSTIQAEVEYGENREQPKSVVMDMAPELLEKIYSSEPAQWLGIFNVFISGLDKKDILMYFKDLNLERFVAEKDFGGLIKNTDSDYLMVTLTNVKGSKTDKVIDNFIKASVRFEDGQAIHKLELTRQHNGGGTRYGFYNRRNPSFVRVLVPEGSELLSISGNSNPGYKPLMNYNNDFKQDANLFNLESGFHYDSKNKISTYDESGKTGFAFWLITDPGEEKTVELEYVVPVKQNGNIHQVYIQKQPGLAVDNLEFKVGETIIYDSAFDKDIELRFKVE